MTTGQEPIRIGSQPARLLGLIDPASAFWEAMQTTGGFVVHVLAVAERALAERFSEVRPPIRSPFERLQVAESPWGRCSVGAAHGRPAAWPGLRRPARPSWSRA
jgi:flavin reductase (DIM6/NTAB) family NADH-FMN oxidoreductase RutF